MTYKNRRFITGSCILVGSLLWVAQPASAQSKFSLDSGSASSELKEVVVTARKRNENLQTVPVSVTALSAVALKQHSITDIGALESEVPSLFTQQAVDDPQSLTFTMRGRKQSDVTLGVDPAVGLYIDGLYIPRTLGMDGELLDVNRIEVMRGPQGTLYGQNTTGGAISIYTNEPTQHLGGSLDLTGGNFGYANLIGIANVPLTSDLAARFVFQRGRRGGYGSNAIAESIGSEDSQPNPCINPDDLFTRRRSDNATDRPARLDWRTRSA